MEIKELPDNRFQYPALNLEHDEIRLVVLHRNKYPRETVLGKGGTSQTPRRLHCDIKHVKLADKPSYEALSYTWGSPHKTTEISIGRSIHRIRHNLWEALFSLASTGSNSVPFPRYLWIDALCINQNDTTERNHQVAQIGKIYTQAKVVLIWLGANYKMAPPIIRARAYHSGPLN
jgi:hypothetical protein